MLVCQTHSNLIPFLQVPTYLVTFYINIFKLRFSFAMNTSNKCRYDMPPNILLYLIRVVPLRRHVCEIRALEQWVWYPARIKTSLAVPSWPNPHFSLNRISALIKSGMEKWPCVPLGYFSINHFDTWLAVGDYWFLKNY